MFYFDHTFVWETGRDSESYSDTITRELTAAGFNVTEVYIAMEQTGIKTGKNGFEKDKGPERKPDSPESPDEYKTHITDAWDTLFIGMNFFYTEPSKITATVTFLGK